MKYNLDEEIPKHLKKKESNKSRAREKTKHKHVYDVCLLVKDGKPYPASYCILCGKIQTINHINTVKTEEGYSRFLTDEEIFEQYKDVPKFQIESIWQKYVPVHREN